MRMELGANRLRDVISIRTHRRSDTAKGFWETRCYQLAKEVAPDNNLS